MSQVFDFVGNLNIEATLTHQSKSKVERSPHSLLVLQADIPRTKAHHVLRHDHTPATHVGSRNVAYITAATREGSTLIAYGTNWNIFYRITRLFGSCPPILHPRYIKPVNCRPKTQFRMYALRGSLSTHI